MTRPHQATTEELSAFLQANQGWEESGGRLKRLYQFKDFPVAMDFMVRVAKHAERLDHHPDWSNTYRRVEVQLYTHDVGSITALDFELAQAMEKEATALQQLDS
jgi:4a-hydroxytetrahydrobiopterin dehydratase